MATPDLDADVLGIVVHSHYDKDGKDIEFCRLRPCYIRANGAWHPILNAKRDFPADGLVFWFRPKGAPEEGSIWIISLGESHNYDGKKKKDLYQVRHGSSPKPVFELFELERQCTIVDLRRTLSEGRILLPSSPVGSALIRIPGEEDLYIGPFRVQRDSTADGRYLIDNNVVTGFASIKRVDQRRVSTVFVDEISHRILDGDVTSLEAAGFFNVQSDQDLLRSALKRARKWSPKIGDAVSGTRQVLDAYLTELRAVELNPDERQREAARALAGKALVEAFTFEADVVQAVVEQLLETPLVQERLIIREREELARRLTSRQAEIESSCSELSDKLVKLRQEEVELRSALDVLPAQVRGAADDALKGYIPKLADHLVREVFFGPRNGVNAKRTRHPSRDKLLGSKEALVRTITDSARSRYLDPVIMITLAGLCAGWGIVVVSGRKAEAMASSLGRALGGSQARRVSISATIFSVSDLLNAPCSSFTGEGTPEVLGDFLKFCRLQNQVAVVVLGGINRTTPESFLPELADACNPNGSCRSLAWTDRKGEPQEVSLDNKIVFVATTTDGGAVFPLNVHPYHRIPITSADRDITPAEALGGEGAVKESTGVDESLWTALHNDVTPLEIEKWSLPDGLMQKEFTTSLERMAGILSSIATSGAEALASVSIGRVPHAALKELARPVPEAVRKHFFKIVEDETTKQLESYFK